MGESSGMHYNNQNYGDSDDEDNDSDHNDIYRWRASWLKEGYPHNSHLCLSSVEMSLVSFWITLNSYFKPYKLNLIFL